MKEQWTLQTKRADFSMLGQACGIPSIIARVLVNRGLTTEAEMTEYLRADRTHLHSPFQMRGIKEAVDMIQREREGFVAIASDFDCDGIFSALVLSRGLEKLGIKNRIYTPDRVKEGYGLNDRIVEEAHADGATMILTCDNGIAAKDEIRKAKELGIKVVVTDHHEVQGDIPEADVVVDPKQPLCEYPYKELCGAGVAFKLVQALMEKEGTESEELFEEYLSYVAIATVADVMDLTGENRILVKEGLKCLQKTKNLGLQALMQQQGIWDKPIRSYHLGYVLGPCFNASGRLETVAEAFSLLKAKNQAEAQKAAVHLKELNDIRKEMTEQETERAYQMLESDGKVERVDSDKLPPVILLNLQECHESLAGIIAGRIRERFYRPVIVFTETESGLLKGSGRSTPAYDMFAKLYCHKELMERFGGHPMAAGLTIKKENFETLKRCLCEESELTDEKLKPEILIDADMPIGYVTKEIIKGLEKLEPLGKGNPKPIFARLHFKIWRAVKRGQNGTVLVMNVSEAGKTERMDAILFGRTEEFEAFVSSEYGEENVRKMYRGEPNDIDVAFAYYPAINTYHGYDTIQIQVSHFCRVNV